MGAPLDGKAGRAHIATLAVDAGGADAAPIDMGHHGACAAMGSPDQEDGETMTSIDEWADLYRDLHRHPELGFQETRTARVVPERLEAIGLEVTSEIGGTGVVGILRNGDGPTVLLRADMDGLPVEEQTGLPYASTSRAVAADGRRHRGVGGGGAQLAGRLKPG